MQVFYDMFKGLIFTIALTLFLYTGYIVIAKTIEDNQSTEKLNLPKNVEVLGIEDEKDLDLCKDYNFDVKEDPSAYLEGADIQENIGYQNNKFGLYIYRVDDFAIKAAEMVNSNGGDWGYVLVPYNVKDYDSEKWNKFFVVLREKHLIPIIQLWDISEDPVDMERDTRKSAQFLNSLSWPVKNRYVSVYNEVNDERFWKSGINPKEYAELLEYTIDTYKAENEDFYMLNGAFNASARTGGGYLDSRVFMREMDNAVSGIFEKLDGWASHPYPHVNGYLGTPNDSGRDSIRAYEWELQILEDDFGVKDLPVFITETGWPHAEGNAYNADYYDEETAAEYLKQAFENVWLKDDRVVAVTPFTIKYDAPYDHFSFIKGDGSTYKVFDVIKDMDKVKGRPPLVPVYDPLKEKCRLLLEAGTGVTDSSLDDNK